MLLFEDKEDESAQNWHYFIQEKRKNSIYIERTKPLLHCQVYVKKCLWQCPFENNEGTKRKRKKKAKEKILIYSLKHFFWLFVAVSIWKRKGNESMNNNKAKKKTKKDVPRQ